MHLQHNIMTRTVRANVQILLNFRSDHNRLWRYESSRYPANALQAAGEAGMCMIGAACLKEREEADGRPTVEVVAPGAPFLSVFGGEEFHTEYLHALTH